MGAVTSSKGKNLFMSKEVLSSAILHQQMKGSCGQQYYQICFRLSAIDETLKHRGRFNTLPFRKQTLRSQNCSTVSYYTLVFHRFDFVSKSKGTAPTTKINMLPLTELGVIQISSQLRHLSYSIVFAWELNLFLVSYLGLSKAKFFCKAFSFGKKGDMLYDGFVTTSHFL